MITSVLFTSINECSVQNSRMVRLWYFDPNGFVFSALGLCKIVKLWFKCWIIIRVGSYDSLKSNLLLMEHLPKWKCQNKISYISHPSMMQHKHVRFWIENWLRELASSMSEEGTLLNFSLLLSHFLWKLLPAKWERNDFQPFSASVSIWIVQESLSLQLLMFWHEIKTSGPPMPCLFWSSINKVPSVWEQKEAPVGGGSTGEVGCCNTNGSIFIWKLTLSATWEGQLSGGR